MNPPLNTSSRSQEIAALSAITGVFLAFLLFVPPTGEFPSGDDFDLAASAWHLAETGNLTLSDWPEMTLVGHILWGGLFAKIGGSTFFVLRLSMFAMSAIIAMTLYAWSRKYGNPRSLSVWFAITFAVNPVIVNLEYTFLNDLSGIAAAALLLLLAPRFDTSTRWPLIGYSILGGTAYCTRETAAVPFLIYCGLACLHFLRTKRYGNIFWLLAPCGLIFVSYQLWLHVLHGVPSFRNLPNLHLGSLAHHFRRLLFVCGHLSLLLLPVSVLLVARKRLLHERRVWFVSTLVVSAAIGISLLVFGNLRAPYVGQFYDIGMRMPELPATNLPEDLRGPRLDWGSFSISWFRLVMTWLSAASAVVMGTWILAQWRRVRRTREPLELHVTLAVLTSIAMFLLYLVTYSYFERYTPTLLLPIMMSLAALLPTQQLTRRAVPLSAWLVTGAIGLLSLVGIQDGMQRSRAFWSVIDEIHELGVEPHHVDAGLAYAGFYRFNTHYRGEKNVGPFLSNLSPVEHDVVMAAMSPESITANRDFRLSFKKASGYDVVATRTYQSWFRSGIIYIQLRDDVDRRLLSKKVQQWLAENP